MKTIRETVAAHPFLAGLEPGQIDSLAQFAMLRDFEDREVIFEQGDLANRFYLINAGHVLVSSESSTGETVEIEMLGDGDVLGWSWMFEPCKWQFDAAAVGDTETIFFYATPLLAQLDADPALGYELMRRMARITVRRLQKTRERLVNRAVE